MKKKGCLIPLGIVAALVAWGVIYTWPETHRYRMTVEVETPQGLRTGSSVIETSYRKEIKVLPDQLTGTIRIRGEAVMVELPDGQTLFALLRGESVRTFDDIVYDTLGGENSPHMRVGAPPVPIARNMMNPARGQDNQISGLPLLVRFLDIHDPRTIKKVDPESLAVSFGSGVVLKRITLQVTDDPVTSGIANKIPWLNHLERYRRDTKNPFTSTLPTEIGSFRSK